MRQKTLTIKHEPWSAKKILITKARKIENNYKIFVLLFFGVFEIIYHNVLPGKTQIPFISS